MTTILFFDDWLLETHQNIVRKMGVPQWVREADFADPYTNPDPLFARSCYYPSVFWDEGFGRWRAFYTVWAKALNGIATLATAESDDGIHWEVPDLSMRFPNGSRIMKNEIFIAGRGNEAGAVYLDLRDPDPERRYKLLYLPGPYTDYVNNGIGKNRLAVSADGYDWIPVEGVEWGDWLSDTANWTYYNEQRESYVSVVRAHWGDRRVSFIETRDWKHWSKPEVVVHPDPLDPPLVQYYGMPVAPYEGMYIGLLWMVFCDPLEIRADKRRGPVDCQLAYSYNGWHFNRTFREPFIALNEPGLPGCGSIYPSDICVDKDNVIRIYSNAWKTEHHCYRDPRNDVTGLMMHTLRLDGFMYLESRTSVGSLMTKCIKFRTPELKLNVQVPSGDASVQISDHDGVPIDGLTFDDCIPFTGDDLFWEPVWKSGKSIKDILNKPVRIEVRMYRGRLYAIRAGFAELEYCNLFFDK